ncbi:MAG: hypothetical protein ABI718_12015 [Acidobacteriota bacterium]
MDSEAYNRYTYVVSGASRPDHYALPRIVERLGAVGMGEEGTTNELPLDQMIVRPWSRFCFAAGWLIFASSAFGQAIVLDQGQFTFGSSYQHTFVRYHVGFDGKKADLGHIMSYSIRPEGSYGLTDRITIDGDVAFSASKYIGSQPHGRLDDGTFHSTLQDFHVGVRANWLIRPLYVTPYMRLTVPSHHYELEGHTATGKGKLGLTSGLYAGRDFGPFLPNAYFEMMGSHTWVQRTTIDTTSERLNRTNGSLEFGYYLTPAVTLSAFGIGLRTHGGWELPRRFNNQQELVEHDRFDKSKDVQLGGTVAYTLRGSLTIYAGYFTTPWARTAHELAGPTFGFTWSPRRAQPLLACSPTRPAMLLAQR